MATAIQRWQKRTTAEIMNLAQSKSLKFVGEANFESEVLRSTKPVLAVFWASWSQPCQVIDSVLVDVAATCGENVEILKVDADDNPDLGLWYGVHSIPTLLCFVAGNLRGQLVGTASKEAILSLLGRAEMNSGASSPNDGQWRIPRR